jgi:hypothetical protein
MAAIVMTMIAVVHHDNMVKTAASIFMRRPRGRGPGPLVNPGGPRAASSFAKSLLNGSPRRFVELFRIHIPEFNTLLQWLRDNTWLCDSRYLTAELKLMVFLWILAYNEPQRNAAHMFGVCQRTISQIFDKVLRCFVKVYAAFVQLPPDDYVSPDIELNPRLKHFNGCIGAVDGTHIYARVPPRDQQRYRGRKGFTSQNVFAAVKFDGSFSYVLAGNEGTMNDSRLLRRALNGGQFRVPENRYYITDGGFGERPGFIVPFPLVRYHLQEWRAAQNKPTNSKELYNLRHSSARVKIEQAFGFLKRRSKIIRQSAPEYSMEKQQAIVYACAGLWNFIHKLRTPPGLTDEELRYLEEAKLRADRRNSGKTMEEIRRTSAVRHWNSYQGYLAQGDRIDDD